MLAQVLLRHDFFNRINRSSKSIFSLLDSKIDNARTKKLVVCDKIKVDNKKSPGSPPVGAKTAAAGLFCSLPPPICQSKLLNQQPNNLFKIYKKEIHNEPVFEC